MGSASSGSLTLCFNAGHELADMIAQAIVRIGGDVVKLIDGDQSVIEDFDAELFDREAKCGMRAN